MEPDWKLMSKVRDAAVQDGCPDTVLANDGPAADDLIAIRLEVVVAAAAPVRDVEKMAMEETVMEEVQAMRESLTQRQVNTAVQAIIRTFC
jgi:hypothetical protein